MTDSAITPEIEGEENGLTYAEALLLREQLQATRSRQRLIDLSEMSMEDVLEQSAEWRQDYALLNKIRNALSDPEKRRQWMRDNGVPVYDHPAPAPRAALFGEEYDREIIEQRRNWSASLDGPKFRGYGGPCTDPEHRVGFRLSHRDMDGFYPMGGGDPKWEVKHANRRPDIAPNQEGGDTALVDKINGGWGGRNY